MSSIIWVGLDVHKNSVTAAILADESHQSEVIKMSSDMNQIRRLFRRLAERGAVRSCYEASGAGYVLQRTLQRDGFRCEVIAPSLIPRKPGERRKTDRLDALQLAKLYRSGHLTAIRIPSEEQEAVRCLVRLRYAYQEQVKRTKQRMNGVLLAQGRIYRDSKCHWTKKHRAWLEELRRETEGAVGTVLRVELEHLEYLEAQRNALDDQIERYSCIDPYREVVDALCCMRGIQTLTAMTLTTEIGDARRFDSPRALMSWVGLVPKERSSGDRERKGSITRAGNGHVRRVLIESAWQHRHRTGANLMVQRRRMGKPPEVVAIAVKAQHRLHKRFWRLQVKKHANKVAVAVARELLGFVWAIMREAPQPQG